MDDCQKLRFLAKICRCYICGGQNLETTDHKQHLSLVCLDCDNSMQYDDGCLDCLGELQDKEFKTSEHYGRGWLADKPNTAINVAKWHFDEVVKITGNPLDMGGIGLEAGCGHGKDTVRLATSNPNAIVIAIDLSAGVKVAAERCKRLGITNVVFVRASLLDIPIRNDVVDWIYSFGVLHHTPSPEQCMSELNRVSNEAATLALYLYSDLSEHPIKKFFLNPISWLRLITKRLPLPILSLICYVLAPLVFCFLTLPARTIKIAGFPNKAKQIPHHHNQTVKSIVGELYDRLGAQIEYRYDKQRLHDLHSNHQFQIDLVDEIPDWRGWVSLANKSPN